MTAMHLEDSTMISLRDRWVQIKTKEAIIQGDLPPQLFLSVRFIVELEIESASSRACLSW